MLQTKVVFSENRAVFKCAEKRGMCRQAIGDSTMLHRSDVICMQVTETRIHRHKIFETYCFKIDQFHLICKMIYCHAYRN